MRLALLLPFVLFASACSPDGKPPTRATDGGASDLALVRDGGELDDGGGDGGSTAAQLTIAPGSRDFGQVGVGQSSSSVSFTITNSGSGASTALTTTLAGNDGSDFVIGSDGCSQLVLAPQASCVVSLTFAPTALGARAAQLTVGVLGQSAGAALSGTGVAPAALVFSPSPFDFGTVDATQSSTPQTFTLTNSGALPSGTIATSINGDGAQFTVTSDGCDGQVLMPNAHCDVAITFAPTTYGGFALTLGATAAPGGSATATMSGTGRVYNTLSVTIAGNGSGTVSASGLTCSGTSCSGQYARTSATAPAVVVTVAPASGSTVTWSGDSCSGTAPTCTITVDAAKSETVTFTIAQLTLTVKDVFIAGATGKVSAADSSIDCGTSCSAVYAYDTSVVLTATPDAGALFQGWSGACTGNTPTCTVAVTQSLTVTATFRPPVNYAFTTSQTFTPGALGGLAGADQACQSLADAAGLGGHYVALMSTSTVDAASRIVNASGWMRTDGKPIGGTPSSILNDYIIDYPIDVDEHGTLLGGPNTLTATGSTANGKYRKGDSCGDWTSTTGYGTGGAIWTGGSEWLTGDGFQCSESDIRLRCFETDYVTPVTPTPASGIILFVSKGIFNPSTGLAGADALCAGEAATAQLPNPTTYLAVLNTSQASAASRFPNNYNTQVIRPDGVVVVYAQHNFFDGVQTVAAPSMCADKSDPGFSENIVTGGGLYDLNGEANNATETCNDWTSAATSSTVFASGGDPNWLGEYNIHFGGSDCDATNIHVYCLQSAPAS